AHPRVHRGRRLRAGRGQPHHPGGRPPAAPGRRRRGRRGRGRRAAGGPARGGGGRGGGARRRGGARRGRRGSARAGGGLIAGFTSVVPAALSAPFRASDAVRVTWEAAFRIGEGFLIFLAILLV